jgi:two-component system phosphate regulon sensor histidine kinase PhoR
MATDSPQDRAETELRLREELAAPERTGWHRLVPLTLGGRLALTFGLITAIATIGLGIYLNYSIRAIYLDRIEQTLLSDARVVGRSLSSDLTANAGIDVIDPQVKAFSTDIEARITIVAPDGTVIGDSTADPRTMNNHGARPEIAAAEASGERVLRRQSGTVDESFLYAAVQVPGADGYIAETALPASEVDHALADIRRRIALGTIAAVILSVGAGIFVSRRLATDIGAVRDSAISVASGDLDVTIEPPVTRELGDLARAFNQMTNRVSELLNESRRARMRWASAFASIGDGMILVDDAEQVTAVNPAAAKLLGVDMERAIGQPFVVVVRDHEVTALLRESQRVQLLKRGEIDFIRRELVLEATARPVAGYGERYSIVSLRDVTELRRLETVRREFVANVSHELRTPLASIRAVVETLEAGAIDDPTVSGEFLGRIVGEVDRLAALVDDLLDLARLESGRIHLQVEPLDPRRLLSGAAERLRPQIERARLKLEIDIPAGLPPVLADRDRIEQVMLNLVHNAIKFTPPDGTITVKAERDGQMLKASIIDTGSGIPEADLARLFERFYKADKARRSDGTGLGLAITKHIVQSHGGDVTAESEPGSGSTFIFTLPIAEEANTPGYSG